MTLRESGTTARRLDGLFDVGTASGLGEGVLLERFVSRRDGSAFEAIVARHGPMVWAVCRRALRDPNDVDDAFQATFLILARKAGSIRGRDRLGPWLHGVAYRVSARARRDAEQCGTLEITDRAGVSPSELAECRERAHVLHEEIERLPGKYRDPIVLCHLEGCTHEEAAERLGWPVGTVRGRLARGRDRLRERLTRRGLASAAVLDGVSSALPEVLIERTVRGAIGFAAGGSVASAASARALSWAERGLHAMKIASITSVVMAALAAAVLIAAGAGALALAQGPGKSEGGVTPNGSATTITKGTERTVASTDTAAQTKGSSEKPEPEVSPERLADLEAEVELLTIEVNSEKERLTACLAKLDEVRQQPYELVGADQPMRNRAKLSHERQVETLEQMHAVLRKTYLQDRAKLSLLERDFKRLEQKASGSAVDQPLPLALDRRLSAIEDTLKSILKAVEKEQAAKPTVSTPRKRDR